MVMMTLNGKDVSMEVDTGTSLSIISETTYGTFQPAPPMRTSNVKLTTYTGENVLVVGAIDVAVARETQVKELSLLVVDPVF